jgi:hypothetical protein
MPKHTVTGGEDGTAGVTIKDIYYAPGDTVEVVNPKKEWLVKAGYLALSESKPSKPAPTVRSTSRTGDDG